MAIILGGPIFHPATVDLEGEEWVCSWFICKNGSVTELRDGIFVGGSVNHLLADGTSFWDFMATWSEIFTSKDHEIIISYRVLRYSNDGKSEQGMQHAKDIKFTGSVRTFVEIKPALPDDYFGSPVDIISGTATVEDLMAHGLGWAAWRIHEAVSNHDDAAVKKWVESWYRNPVVYKRNGLFHPNTTHIGSSPRFDMYGCEFGLGKALAARSGFMNKADGKMTMYPGREGGGSMDVEVCLLPEYMMELECDEEFISVLENN
ncbi:hypothetical protein L1987_80495 [Smallanthus sonchifolius]|uniref:Uncharacterized protein n=1 Tax=Smallanthus sonchifolius TaxID=185202 RepID=A0ACB8YNI1_9ASTR|nr:hypothetical protein L1987_80495 [Smallanthus sonchifolius]